MTDPRDMRRDREADPTADPQPEVKPEVIKDLDVPREDDDAVAGGRSCYPNPSHPSCLGTKPF